MTKKKKKVGAASKSKGGAKGKGISLPTLILGIGAAITVRFVVKMIPMNFKGAPWVVAGGQLVIGYLLTRNRNQNIQGLGFGMVVSGGVSTFQTLGLITGIGRSINFETPMRRVRGPRDVDVIAGVEQNKFPAPGNVGRRRNPMGSVGANGY